jgi:hypothetical protein
MDYDTDMDEDLDLVELQVGGMKAATVGIVKNTGMVYIGGDLHPLGSFAALMLAAKEHVPYVALSAISVLFPAEWIRAACLHDVDRQRVIDNLEKHARSAG